MNRKNLTAAVLAGILFAAILTFFSPAMAAGPPELFFESEAEAWSDALRGGAPDRVVSDESVTEMFVVDVSHRSSATVLEQEADVLYLVYDTRHSVLYGKLSTLLYFMNDGVGAVPDQRETTQDRTMSKEVWRSGSRTA